MVSGFALPLYLVISVISVVAITLMLPKPLYIPAVKFCVFTKTNALARTVINTTAAVMCMMLIAPAYDYYNVSKFKELKVTTEPGSVQDQSEIASQLNASLLGSVIAMMFLVRHLGVCMAERDDAMEKLQQMGIETEGIKADKRDIQGPAVVKEE